MIVGFRSPIPRTVVRTLLELDHSGLYLWHWYPDIKVRDEAGLCVLAGWEIHREVVE